MPHQDFVRPDGQWPPEFVLTPGDLRRFDVAQFQAIDGDGGGTWVPLTPITIGGQGLVLLGSTFGHLISGGVLTLSGGRVYLGASIYPSFVAPVSRVIDWMLLARSPIAQATNGTRFASKSTIGGTPAVNAFSLPIPSRQLHNGATIASANVTFQIGLIHQMAPAVLPQALFVRSDWLPWNPPQYFSNFRTYAAGALVHPSMTYPNWPLIYAATGAGGTTGGSEPNWATASQIGQTVIDSGGITWVATGYSVNPPPWAASTGYSVGINVIQPTHANGLVYACTAISGTGHSSTTEPVWPLTPGATVIDNPGGNQVVWTCIGTPRAATWKSGTAYLNGTTVTASPDNGMYYWASTAGTSGGAPPAWGTTVGGTTPDGSGALVWTCLGSNPVGAGSIASGTAGGYPATGTAYFDGGATQAMSLPCSGATVIDTVDYSYAYILYDEGGLGACEPIGTQTWVSGTFYNLLSFGPFVEPSPPNGYYYACTVGGISGSPPPVWPTVIGGTVTELHGSGGSGGTGPTWQCFGLAEPSQNLFMVVSFSFTSIADMRPE